MMNTFNDPILFVVLLAGMAMFLFPLMLTVTHQELPVILAFVSAMGAWLMFTATGLVYGPYFWHAFGMEVGLIFMLSGLAFSKLVFGSRLFFALGFVVAFLSSSYL